MRAYQLCPAAFSKFHQCLKHTFHILAGIVGNSGHLADVLEALRQWGREVHLLSCLPGGDVTFLTVDDDISSVDRAERISEMLISQTIFVGQDLQKSTVLTLGSHGGGGINEPPRGCCTRPIAGTLYADSMYSICSTMPPLPPKVLPPASRILGRKRTFQYPV